MSDCSSCDMLKERHETYPEDEPLVHDDVDDRVLLKLSSSGMTTRSYDA